METNWLFVIYIILLIDSMGAMIMSWFGQKWWMTLGPIAKIFPPAKGWTVLYFCLMLIIGHLLGFY